MSNLNHDRPLFKVLDAGGGERVRTIAEELEDARVSPPAGPDRRRAVPKCELCGSTKVSSRRLRCATCVAETETVREARLQLAADVAPPRSTSVAARPRPGLCPQCYTQMPVAGACGYCA